MAASHPQICPTKTTTYFSDFSVGTLIVAFQEWGSEELLAGKLAICLVASTADFFSLFGWVNLRLERRHFERMVLLSAERVSDIIQSATRHEMLSIDRASLSQQIGDIGHEPGIDRVRIFNKEGLISFSSEAGEVGTLVNK